MLAEQAARRRCPSGSGRFPGCRGSRRRSPYARRGRSAAARRGRRPRPSGSRRDRPAARPPRPVRRGPARRSRRASRRRSAAFSARSPARLSKPPLPAVGGDAGHLSRRRSSRPATAAPVRLAARRARRRPARTGRSKCRPRRSPIRRRRGATAASQLAAAAVEQRLLGQRPRRDQADDRALDQRLGPARLARLGRAFDLLGDGDAVAGADQPGEIGFGGMDRHAAHRHRLAAVRAALGQRDVEAGRGGLGVVEEQLEEIAHPVEQQRIARLGLEAVILRHHRRLLGRRRAGHSPSR